MKRIRRVGPVEVVNDIVRIWTNAERGKASIIKPYTALVLRNLALPSIKDKNTIVLPRRARRK